MPVSRMRMRPWLEHMISSRKVEGLYWLDMEKTLFSIPWKHAARHGWEVGKDASLFKEWAIHTGKYVEGQTEPDPKTWKANFRCALNSLPDIAEVKDKSVHKGHGAVRVYQMLPASPKTRDRRRRAIRPKRQSRVKFEEESSDSDFVPSPIQAHLSSLQDSQLDSTVDSTVDSSVDSSVKKELTDHSYINIDDVPIWSHPGFEFPRRFEVSPAHSSCPDDAEIIEICAQWEKEVHTSNMAQHFIVQDNQWRHRKSPHSDSSSACEGDDVHYVDLIPNSSTSTEDDMLHWYPFSF